MTRVQNDDVVLTSRTGTYPPHPAQMDRVPPSDQETMYQVAPYPHALDDFLRRLIYRPGWRIWLENGYDRGQGSEGLTLIVETFTLDSYDATQQIRVHHLFPVPPAAYNERSWRNWVFEQLGLVDDHERAEFFVVDGERPFAPLHAPGNDPYMRVESTYEEAHTSSRGEFTDTRPRVNVWDGDGVRVQTGRPKGWGEE